MQLIAFSPPSLLSSISTTFILQWQSLQLAQWHPASMERKSAQLFAWNFQVPRLAIFLHWRPCNGNIEAQDGSYLSEIALLYPHRSSCLRWRFICVRLQFEAFTWQNLYYFLYQLQEIPQSTTTTLYPSQLLILLVSQTETLAQFYISVPLRLLETSLHKLLDPVHLCCTGRISTTNVPQLPSIKCQTWKNCHFTLLH